MDKVRVALIGAGGMANSVHYPSLKRFEDVEMAALCDLVPEKLRSTAEKFEIDRTYTDYKKMIEEVDPDAIYVLMPPHHVFDVTSHCLAQKLHVFIEKPPGMTTFQTRNMALDAEKNDCITAVGFQRRHIPLMTKLRAEMETRGPIHQCVCTFYKYAEPTKRYYDGAIDILTCDAIHAVDTHRCMGGGEVKYVSREERNLYGDITNDFNALVTFESGATGILLTNWITGRRFFTVEMHAKGISAFADPDDKAYLYADGNVEGRVFDPKQVAGSQDSFVVLGFYQENRHFIDCIKSKQQPLSHFGDAVKTMELVDQIYQSQI